MSKASATIIASAIIWGAVIIACAFSLKGTPYAGLILYILGMGAIAHLLFVWAPLKKKK